MTRQTRHYINVGLAIVVALVLLGLSVQWLRGTFTFARNYALVVAFRDARGITDGAEGRMAGVRIGRVGGGGRAAPPPPRRGRAAHGRCADRARGRRRARPAHQYGPAAPAD